jgi:hypothetical protein
MKVCDRCGNAHPLIYLISGQYVCRICQRRNPECNG